MQCLDFNMLQDCKYDTKESQGLMTGTHASGRSGDPSSMIIFHMEHPMASPTEQEKKAQAHLSILIRRDHNHAQVLPRPRASVCMWSSGVKLADAPWAVGILGRHPGCELTLQTACLPLCPASGSQKPQNLSPSLIFWQKTTDDLWLLRTQID